MNDWTAITVVADLLPDFPARWAPFRGIRREGVAARDEVQKGLEIVRQGLLALGPVAREEPTDARFPGLVEDRRALIAVTPDLRQITVERVRDFCEARIPEFKDTYLSQGVTLSGLATACLRARLGIVAGNMMEDVPTYYRPDPSDLRGLALKWLEDNAHCLRDGDLAGCMGLMVARVGMGLVPLAKRLYHDPGVGLEVKGYIEEIFVPEVVQDIRSGG